MKIVAMGDSLTFGYMIKDEYKWVNILNEKNKDFFIINKGVNGDTTSQMVERFDKDVINIEPDYCLIWGGANDFYQTFGVDEVLDNLKYMYSRSIEKNIKPILILTTPVDESKSYFDTSIALLRAMDEKIQTLGKKMQEKKFNFINLYEEFKKHQKDRDLFNDEVHFNFLGSQVVAKILEEKIKNFII